MFRRLFKGLRYGKDHNVPTTYDPKLHYNCFVESVPDKIRQAVYQELCKRRLIRVSRRLSDGRLQLSVTSGGSGCSWLKGLDALNAVAAGVGEKYDAFKATKASVIKLMMSNPDLQLTFISRSGDVWHAERHHLSELVLESEASLAKGVAYQKRHEYQQAIGCYDEAIRIEPLDFRAWNNKIAALSQHGQDEQAIRVADEILGMHPDVTVLWETKARVLATMGKQFEAGECLSQAESLGRKTEDAYNIDKQMDHWLQNSIKEARKAGKDPDTDVHFWFGKFTEYVQSEEAKKAFLCLQMAARIGPDSIVQIGEEIALLPSFFAGMDLEKVTADFREFCESDNWELQYLRDFYLKMESEFRRGTRGK